MTFIVAIIIIGRVLAVVILVLIASIVVYNVDGLRFLVAIARVLIIFTIDCSEINERILLIH